MNKISKESDNVETTRDKGVKSTDLLTSTVIIIMYLILLIFFEFEKCNDKRTDSRTSHNDLKPVITPK